MKRNLLYFLLLIVLGFATYYFVFKEKDDSFAKDEANFTVENINKVTTILMSNLEGKKVKIFKHQDKWLLNDSMEIVESRIEDLIEALTQQKAIQPVRLGSHDQVIKEMSSDNTKVEVYSGKTKTHTFYVSKSIAPNNLTYMLTEGAKRPYIVKLPLQDVFLGVRYSADEDSWRTRKIMKAKATEIEMIDVRFKDSTQYSFNLKMTPRNKPLLSGTQTIGQDFNSGRVGTYLNLWDSIYCLGYETRNRIKDTILTKGKELATITLKLYNQPAQTLTIFFKPISKGTKAILKVGQDEFDFDSYIGFLNKKDMIVLTRNYAQLMLRTYQEFFDGMTAPIENPAPQ